MVALRAGTGHVTSQPSEANVRVAVIGQGYVGLPLSMAMAFVGHTVHAVESNIARLDALKEGHSYIVDVRSAELRRELDAGRFRPVADLDGVPPADVYVIATPTPVTEQHQPDLRYVDEALAVVAGSVQPGALVVVESTIYPGALRNHLAPLLERMSGLRSGVDVFLAYSPDRVDPGRDTAIREVPKLVAGLCDKATTMAEEFYGSVFKEVVSVSTCEVAEFTKLFENTFRFVNIAFVNELSIAANAMNVSFREVVAAASTKPFGYMPFHHGPGVGGHCLPGNVHYLQYALGTAGHQSDLLEAASRVNDAMPRHAVQRLASALEAKGRSLKQANVLVLGLAFKSGVADCRNSPALAICQALAEADATVRATDPWITDGEVSELFTTVKLTDAQCDWADAVMVVTDHEQLDYQTVLRSDCVVLDCRGILQANGVEQL